MGAPDRDEILTPMVSDVVTHQCSLFVATEAIQVYEARDEFFHTRTEGRPEIWAAIRTVANLVEEGELEDAQAILNASHITCPSGILHGRDGGVFDQQGHRYTIPVWCVGWPRGIPYKTRSIAEAADHKRRPIMHNQEAEFRSTLGCRTDAQGYDADGPTPVVRNPGDLEEYGSMHGHEITVRVRLSSTGNDILVRTGSSDLVKSFIQRVGILELPIYNFIL